MESRWLWALQTFLWQKSPQRKKNPIKYSCHDKNLWLTYIRTTYIYININTVYIYLRHFKTLIFYTQFNTFWGVFVPPLFLFFMCELLCEKDCKSSLNLQSLWCTGSCGPLTRPSPKPPWRKKEGGCLESPGRGWRWMGRLLLTWTPPCGEEVNCYQTEQS